MEAIPDVKEYDCCALHADDVRTLITSKESLEAQVALVKRFTEMNFLKLNVGKCEVVM